ncbi:hypothetical protein [Rothia nasimurium]|uniref:hypothetical protein n=1 Tax=Rothia nasimurium TaxID=85336 RepID=UPI001F2B9BEE|nr:hypothetical protein [Rothia nasimurium]
MTMSFFTPVASASAKFPTPGATITGEITEISEPMQARKYEDNSPDYWPSGDPVMQVKVTLQTDERDPQIQDDDGKRALWVRQSSQMLYAIQAGMKAAGQSDLQVGGRLQVTYTGDDPNSKNPRNPRKLYSAVYQAPAAGGGMFTGQGQAQGQAPVQGQSAQPQYQAQPPAQSQQAAAPQQGYSQQTQGGNYADPAMYQQAAPQPPAQPQYQPQQAPAPAQPAPAAPTITPEQENSIKTLIGQGIDTTTIVNALANPNITPQVVDTYRTAA